MAESWDTLAGLVQFNDQNLADLDITDLLQDAPLLQVLHAQVASNGTLHKYLKQTTASSAAFRAVGAGLTKTNSADTLVTDTLAILDGSYEVDVALADAYTKGGADAYIEKELVRTMKTVMFETESQIIYGTGNDATGYAGLADDGQLDASSDTMVTTPASAGAGSANTSVFFLRSGMDDVSAIIGEGGNINVADPVIQRTVVNPGTDNKVFPAYYVAVTGYSGFQIGGAYSAARLCNIDTATPASTTALTDDDLYGALSLFPAARQPNLIVMNRTSLRMLRNSRTSVNATGAPAPRPESLEGIPIIVTDAILNTEATI
jgi:hypothetical protein